MDGSQRARSSSDFFIYQWRSAAPLPLKCGNKGGSIYARLVESQSPLFILVEQLLREGEKVLPERLC